MRPVLREDDDPLVVLRRPASHDPVEESLSCARPRVARRVARPRRASRPAARAPPASAGAAQRPRRRRSPRASARRRRPPLLRRRSPPRRRRTVAAGPSATGAQRSRDAPVSVSRCTASVRGNAAGDENSRFFSSVTTKSAAVAFASSAPRQALARAVRHSRRASRARRAPRRMLDLEHHDAASREPGLPSALVRSCLSRRTVTSRVASRRRLDARGRSGAGRAAPAAR